MSKLQISVIYIFCLVLLLEKVLTSYIVISDSEVSMSNAFLHCREIGGTLLTNKEVFAYADQIKSQCPEVKEFFWIGNFSTITPTMSLEGCYKYENQSVGYFVIPENSVAKCQARCFTEAGIAIKGDVCQCLSLTQIASLTRVDALQCDIITNGEVRGGTGNKMSIYLKQGRNVVSGETEDWLNVMQTCTTNNSYIISITEFVENRDSLCGSGQSTRLWTNRRQYIDKLTIPGDGIPENYIHNENIVCQLVNMTSLTFVQTRQCNGNQRHGYLCKTDSLPSNESISCIVTIDDEPLKPTSTYRTDLSKSTQTNSLRTTVAGNINVQNTDCKKTSNAGVIVSSTVAFIFALTSVGLFIYIIKRRLAEKESAIRSTYEVVERNRNPEAEMTYDQIITNEET